MMDNIKEMPLEAKEIVKPHISISGAGSYINITEVKSRELDELIKLAEDVSESIIHMNNKRFIFGIMSGLNIIFLVTAQLLNNFSHTMNIILIIICLILLVYLLVKINRLKRDIKHEQSILERLFSLIHHQKENLQQDVSIVSRAIYEMKLSRMNFDVKKLTSIF